MKFPFMTIDDKNTVVVLERLLNTYAKCNISHKGVAFCNKCKYILNLRNEI